MVLQFLAASVYIKLGSHGGRICFSALSSPSSLPDVSLSALNTRKSSPACVCFSKSVHSWHACAVDLFITTNDMSYFAKSPTLFR